MSLTTLKVFNQYRYTAYLEAIAQQVNLFNTATRGGINLSSALNQGDFSDETLYARIPGLVRRRNAYVNTAVTAKELAMLLETSVKVDAGTPPVNIDPHWWQRILRSPEEAGVVLGKQLAEDTLQDFLNTGIAAYVGATLNVGASVVYDGTAVVNSDGGVASLNKFNKGAALFGDRAQDIAAWVLHSKVWHDVVDRALTNTSQLFVFGTVKVMQDGLGRPFVVSDSPSLILPGDPEADPVTTDTYYTAGLVPGAIVVEQNNDYLDNIETTNGNESINRTFQAQWSFNMAVKGYAWDKTNGGKSPSTAALATGTNWDRFATSTKDLAGVIVKTK
jgi:hypothetical protein